MLPVELKIREILNFYHYGLASQLDKLLEEKLGKNYSVKEFSIISMDKENRFIKISINNILYRINLLEKKEKHPTLYFKDYFLYLEGLSQEELLFDYFTEVSSATFYSHEFYKKLKEIPFGRYDLSDFSDNELLNIFMTSYNIQKKRDAYFELAKRKGYN